MTEATFSSGRILTGVLLALALGGCITSRVEDAR